MFNFVLKLILSIIIAIIGVMIIGLTFSPKNTFQPIIISQIVAVGMGMVCLLGIIAVWVLKE